ncbi:hypothetical protein BU17DRAFT_93947 [Hysterangium stoloniferum]|nr:hypothetical protein BU17DRAFT_93947 [Hysterangium stoloniferum]
MLNSYRYPQLLHNPSRLDVLFEEPDEHRDMVLDIFERLTFPIRSPVASPFLSSESTTAFNLRIYSNIQDASTDLAILPPSIHEVAQLCTAIRYKTKKLVRAYREMGIAVDNYVQFPSKDVARNFETDRDRYISSHFLATPSHRIRLRPQHSPFYTLGMLEGQWDGAFFTPCVVTQDSPPSGALEICVYETSMRHCIREYYAFEGDTVVTQQSPDGSEQTIFFSEEVQWCETPTGLLVFDSKTGMSQRYYNLCSGKELLYHGKRIVDTVIATEDVERDTEGEREVYKFLGRVHNDGLVAFASDQYGYLGFWNFQGRIYGGNELVGDWRTVAELITYGPGQQGWFSLTKVDLLNPQTREVSPMAPIAI